MHWLGLNWLDIIINLVALAIVPGLLAAYGGHLAAEAIQEKDRQRKVKAWFWLLFLAGALVTFWQQFRAAESDLDRSTKEGWANAVISRGFNAPAAPDLSRPKTPLLLPDVTVKVVNPKTPGLMVLTAIQTARDIVAYPLLFDLDRPGLGSLYVNKAEYKWMKAGGYGGPTGLLHQDDLKNGVVKPGDRIFGYISVSCPSCRRDHAYWVYFKFGEEGGWYVESKVSPSPRKISDALPSIRQDVDNFLSTSFPVSQRIAIRESEY